MQYDLRNNKYNEFFSRKLFHVISEPFYLKDNEFQKFSIKNFIGTYFSNSIQSLLVE